MTQNDVVMIGKPVKDMYGASMGKVLGTTTEIDGTIQTVGINCGSEGLKEIPFQQLVVQSDVVIFIPEWRLDAQKMIREKELTIRKLTALMQIISENNNMQSDAEIIHEKYKSKWNSLQETEFTIKSKLEDRITEITKQEQSIKILLFDAKVQAKSNEITHDTFNSVQNETDELLQHMEHEKAEIEKVREKIDNMTLDGVCSDAPDQSIVWLSCIISIFEGHYVGAFMFCRDFRMIRIDYITLWMGPVNCKKVCSRIPFFIFTYIFS